MYSVEVLDNDMIGPKIYPCGGMALMAQKCQHSYDDLLALMRPMIHLAVQVVSYQKHRTGSD